MTRKKHTEELITWDQFEERFKPLKNKITRREEYNGWLFETYGEDEAYIRKFAQEQPNKVWTILDSDEGIIIASGWHFVNRQGYVICDVAFEDHQSFTVQDEDDKEYNLDLEAIAKQFSKSDLKRVLKAGGYHNDLETKMDIVEFLIGESDNKIKSEQEAVAYIKSLPRK